MKVGKWIERWDVVSSNDKEKTYVVAKSNIGVWGCSCPHWKYRRAECKHIKLIKRDPINLIGKAIDDHFELDKILGDPNWRKQSAY